MNTKAEVYLKTLEGISEILEYETSDESLDCPDQNDIVGALMDASHQIYFAFNASVRGR